MKNFPFTIGADPEFNVVSQGRKVDACYTMQKLLEKDPTFNRNNGLDVEGAGNIGWDGCSSTGELRPSPSSNAKGLTENIGKLFAEYVKRINLFDLSTLSFYSSVGGHIHFQLPNTDISDTKIKNLHRQMASFYLPIMMSENKINLELRTKGGYGSLNDFHGDNYFDGPDGEDSVRTYEFRTPSAEWITTPKIAEATIAYLGTVWNEMINHPKNIKKCSDIIYKNDKQGTALQDLLMSDYTTLTRAMFKDIKKHVQTFEFYPEYKEQIDYIFNPEKVMSDKKKVGYNIIEGWNLVQKNKFTKRDLRSKKKFNERAMSIDLDNTRSLINISYNTDPQCDVFANDISNKAAAFKWKLNKTYFLFGLRKGVNEIMAADMAGNIYSGLDKLKTQNDLVAFRDLFNRMNGRFHNNNGRSALRLDFNTGELVKEDVNTIIVGIPYELRMKRDTTPIIDFIYDIENGTKKPVDRNTVELPNEAGGEFHAIMNRTEQDERIVDNTRESRMIEDIVSTAVLSLDLAGPTY